MQSFRRSNRALDKENEMKVTTEMIESWIGSNNLEVNYLLILVRDLANKDYPVDSFKSDVLNYFEEK